MMPANIEVVIGDLSVRNLRAAWAAAMGRLAFIQSPAARRPASHTDRGSEQSSCRYAVPREDGGARLVG
jgi:hypothetical protein